MCRTPSVMGSAHVNRMCGYVGDVLAMNTIRNEMFLIAASYVIIKQIYSVKM